MVVAAHLTDGEQVAALGIEQEEQAVEEGERAAEEWFEQAIALSGGQRAQACWQLAGTLCIENEAAREMWENLKTDPVFKALANGHVVKGIPAGQILNVLTCELIVVVQHAPTSAFRCITAMLAVCSWSFK